MLDDIRGGSHAAVRALILVLLVCKAAYAAVLIVVLQVVWGLRALLGC